MLTAKIRTTKTIINHIKENLILATTRKTQLLKVTLYLKKHASNLDTSTETEDNDSMGWRSLPEMPLTSEDSDTCDMDETEWLDDNFFYQQAHMVSNLEYAELKLSNFTVKLHYCDPIIALFDTGATCSCISYQLFTKISDKVNVITKTLWVNTASGTTPGPLGIAHLTMNIEEHSFKYNFIICTKLKHILGLEFAQRYKLGVDWDASGTLCLSLDGWEIATAMKKGNTEKQVMTMNEIKLTDKQKGNEKICVVTKHTVTLPPYHCTIVPLTPVNDTESIQTH